MGDNFNALLGHLYERLKMLYKSIMAWIEKILRNIFKKLSY